jgi:hypothetical protein
VERFLRPDKSGLATMGKRQHGALCSYGTKSLLISLYKREKLVGYRTDANILKNID